MPNALKTAEDILIAVESRSLSSLQSRMLRSSPEINAFALKICGYLSDVIPGSVDGTSLIDDAIIAGCSHFQFSHPDLFNFYHDAVNASVDIVNWCVTATEKKTVVSWDFMTSDLLPWVNSAVSPVSVNPRPLQSTHAGEPLQPIPPYFITPVIACRLASVGEVISLAGNIDRLLRQPCQI